LALIQDEQLCIPLSSLKEGKTVFDFHTNLGQLLDDEDQRFLSDIHVHVQVSLVDEDYLVQIQSESKAELVCDRCNETFSGVVTGNVDTLFTFDQEKCRDELDDEVRLLKSQDQSINITQDVVDALFLAVPSKILCSSECKGLCTQCGSNLNKTNCHCTSNKMDPRWEGLKNVHFEDDDE